MKKVLVIHYSQSGQLTEIVDNIMSDFKGDEEVLLHYHDIELEQPFPFPWTKQEFFGAFPDTYTQNPRTVKPVDETILNTTYDLIILGYQVWYLTPSLPITSFLNSEYARRLFQNTPVVTVIGCRNMWVMAQEKMKLKLQELQAKLVGNIVLVDKHNNHISVITIVNWMFTGEKRNYLGIFPKPGVSQQEIDASTRFSAVLLRHLKNADFSSLQKDLLAIGAVKIKTFLIVVDNRGNAIFAKWAQLITTKSEDNTRKREKLIKMFNIYLIIAIWVISPIVFMLFLLAYLPLYSYFRKKKSYYSSVSLKEV